jgi:hypothetical protein
MTVPSMIIQSTDMIVSISETTENKIISLFPVPNVGRQLHFFGLLNDIGSKSGYTALQN